MLSYPGVQSLSMKCGVFDIRFNSAIATIALIYFSALIELPVERLLKAPAKIIVTLI